MVIRSSVRRRIIGRWELIGIVLTCVVIFFGTAMVLYIAYVPGESREIDGLIVSFETETGGSSPGVKHFLHVRLDDGPIVRAAVGSHLTPKVGRRVRLTATQMPLIKIERFRFKEFNDPPIDTNPLLNR